MKYSSEVELMDDISTLESIQCTLLEICGNIKALRWALGDYSDLDFAMKTGVSILQKLDNNYDTNNNGD